MKNRKSTPILMMSLLFLFFFSSPFASIILTSCQDAQLNPNDYARITDVDYKAVVVDVPGSEGRVVVTERLTFDVHAASRDNGFWELWRDLSEDTVDGVPVYYQVNSVKQILPDGTEEIWEESPRLYWEDYDYVSSNPELGPGKWYHSEGPYNEDLRQYECVFFYVDDLYREEVVFEIEYEMYNAALRYNDCSDLYLAMYSEETINHLESFNGQILIPNEDMPAEGNYAFYTYGTDNHTFPYEESDTLNPGYHTFSFSLDEDDLKFHNYNEYLEIDLVSFGEDRHIFTEYAPDNMYSSDDVLDEIREEQEAYANEPQKIFTAKITLLLISLIGSGLFILCVIGIKKLIKGKYIFYKPSQEITHYRDIPGDLDPNFAAFLVFSKHKQPKDDSAIYSSILLSLARKGYVSLEEHGDIVIHITARKKPAAPTPLQTAFGVQEPTPLQSTFGVQEPTPLQSTLDTPETTPLQSAFNVQEPAPEPAPEPLEPLTPCEKLYYNLILRHTCDDSITMNTFQRRISSDYSGTNSFVKDIKNSIVNIGINADFFQKADYTEPAKKMKNWSNTLWVFGLISIILINLICSGTKIGLAFGAFFLFGAACIAGGIYMRHNYRKYILLTKFGEEEYAKWRGLYNFLNSDTLIHDKTYIELPLWEKYLVYATAFGLSEKVIAAIHINCPEAVAEASPILSNPCYRSRRFHHTSGRSFRSAVHTGSSGGGFSGGGGGFGYGGGGRGGGGGGGGH